MASIDACVSPVCTGKDKGNEKGRFECEADMSLHYTVTLNNGEMCSS